MAAKRRGVVRGEGEDRAKLERARAMRRGQSRAETAAWEELRDRRCLGLKFRRQQVIDGFIVDFYCAALRLVVEIDGSVHDDPDIRSSDERRTEILEGLGLRVLRVRTEEVLEGLLTARIAEISRDAAP